MLDAIDGEPDPEFGPPVDPSTAVDDARISVEAEFCAESLGPVATVCPGPEIDGAEIEEPTPPPCDED